jgi:hypothetical protein
LVRRAACTIARRICAAITLAVLLCGCAAGGRTVHGDGDGPLSANKGGGGQALYAPGDPRREDGSDSSEVPWQASFGSVLCLDTPDVATITLEEVRVDTSAAPPVNAEWYTRRFNTLDSPMIGSDSGSAVGPTPWPGAISDVAHTDIVQSCDQVRDAPDVELTELVLVVTADQRGAHIDGAMVDYTADGRPYTLEITWSWILCGEMTTDELLGEEWSCTP